MKGGETKMRKMIALFVSLAFVLGTTGYAFAQTSTPAPAAPAPSTEKKADDTSMDKKPAAKKSMTMEEKKAACLQKAGTDDAKKADCEKRFTAKADKKAAATGHQRRERRSSQSDDGHPADRQRLGRHLRLVAP